MKSPAPILAAALVVLGACADQTATAPLAPGALLTRQGATLLVTSAADQGAGSLREALAAAEADPTIAAIEVRATTPVIRLESPLTFAGSQPLTLDGQGVALDGSALAAGQGALVVTGGGPLELRRIEARKAPGVGFTYLVPATATGSIEIGLTDVVASGNGLHGVLINDQPDYLLDPNSTSSTGSAAGLVVRVTRGRYEGNGLTLIDQDGIRINEGGDGSLVARIRGTRVAGNGGDGIELDERGLGNADFRLEDSKLLQNGSFDPSDYDDGIDVDESGAGDVLGQVVNAEASGNYEQGFDLNENDAGNMDVTMQGVVANDNAEEGIEFEEDDDFAGGGDIRARLTGITALRNGANDGDAGLKLREKGAGNLGGRIANVTASDNLIGGILVREDAGGDLTLELVDATALRNGDDGIKYDENGAGNLTGTVLRALASDNASDGIDAEQATAGTGLLRVRGSTATGNGGSNVKVDAGVVLDLQP
ncbi:MAG: hypothetical protein IPK12_22605 [Gemmatimonadetes bacterium]|nr:hypothetical protein [Gemmatimonadota bacterium]